MRKVWLSAEGWDPVVASHAIRFDERLFGRWSSNALDAVLIDTRSVHSFGMKRVCEVVGIDADLKVVGVSTLKPNRIISFPTASLILELPERSPVPLVGTTIEIDDA